MVEEEQDKGQQNPEDVMKSILQPFADALDQLAAGQVANQAAIKKLANRKPPKAEPLLPPEVTQLLPGLINGVIKIFTTPDTSAAAASKGVLNEKMMAAFEKSMISQWEIGTKTAEANLEQILLNNKAIAKRLTEEY